MKMNQKNQAIFFIVLSTLLCWGVEYFIIVKGGTRSQPFLGLIAAAIPGLVAFLCKFIFSSPLSELGIKKAPFKILLSAYSVPFLMFSFTLLFSVYVFGMSPQVSGTAYEKFISLMLFAATIGVFLDFLTQFLSEVGWRGYLHSKLSTNSANIRDVIIGVVWSLWHLPLVLFGGYLAGNISKLGMALFFVKLIAFSFFLGFIRDKSYSVIATTLAIASQNMWVLAMTEIILVPEASSVFSSLQVSSVLCCLHVLLAAFIVRKRKS